MRPWIRLWHTCMTQLNMYLNHDIFTSHPIASLARWASCEAVRNFETSATLPNVGSGVLPTCQYTVRYTRFALVVA